MQIKILLLACGDDCESFDSCIVRVIENICLVDKAADWESTGAIDLLQLPSKQHFNFNMLPPKYAKSVKITAHEKPVKVTATYDGVKVFQTLHKLLFLDLGIRVRKFCVFP